MVRFHLGIRRQPMTLPGLYINQPYISSKSISGSPFIITAALQCQKPLPTNGRQSLGGLFLIPPAYQLYIIRTQIDTHNTTRLFAKARLKS